MADVKINIIKNGPLIVNGEVELTDSEGNSYPAQKRMALCRCGASTEKPFCDGTHSKVGFRRRKEPCRIPPSNSCPLPFGQMLAVRLLRGVRSEEQEHAA